MALFWTFAEGLILIYLRWGFLSFNKGEGKQRAFLIFCIAVFALLLWLMFGGEVFFAKFVDLEQGFNLSVYRWALWNFFCTLWVLLEGIIMVYVLRIYKTLKQPYKNKGLKTGKNSLLGANFNYGIPLLIVSLFTLYFFYEYNFVSMVNKNVLDAKSIYRISLFYIRVCGFFWILFEWIVAFIGIKAYLFLKTTGDPTQ